MPPVKPIAMAATKWVQRAGVAGEDYANGVRMNSTQAEAAAAANDVWKQATAAAAARDAFRSGVQAAGTDKWKRKALEKGVSRFPQGVQVSAPDYQAATAPYFDTIQSVQLTPRGPTGDPRNYQRVQQIGTALRARKTGGK